MDTALIDSIIAWMDANPYEVFCDRDESIPADVITAHLGGDQEALSNFLSEVEDNAWPYIDWSDTRQELIADLNISDDIAKSSEFSDLFDESRALDTSDYLKQAARNTRLHFAATPYIGNAGEYHCEEDQEECLLLFPHGYLDEAENVRRAAQLLDVLGVENPAEAETCYEFDTLKVIGSLDVLDLIENGPPTHITLGPDDIDQIVTHNRVNGSGGCGVVRITKTITLPAMFRVDDGDRYGVDSVFGFTGQVWRYPLNVERHSAE